MVSTGESWMQQGRTIVPIFLSLLSLACCSGKGGDAGKDASGKELVLDLAGPETRPGDIGDGGSTALDSSSDTRIEIRQETAAVDTEVLTEKKVNLASDANRDGVVSFDDSDEEDEDDWSLEHGAVYFVNADDDDQDGLRDCDDNVVNGPEDIKDLAIILIQPMPWLPAGSVGIISQTFSPDPAHPVFRLFIKQDGDFKALDQGVDFELDFKPGSEDPIVLGLEGVAGEKWGGGVVPIQLAVYGPDDTELGTDSVELRHAPFLLTSSVNPASMVMISHTSVTQTAFVAYLKSLAEAPGYEFMEIGELGQKLSVPAEDDVWLGDAVELAFATLPRGENPQVMYYALKAPRGRPLDETGKDVLLGPDVGWVELADPRQNARYFDWFGNLELSPVLLANEMYHPYGKVYTGQDPENPDWSMHPDVIAFVEAQQLQTPIVYVDTGWLRNGHVSEVVTWIPFKGDPGCCGKGFRMLFASTQEAVDLLQQSALAGHGDALFFEGTELEAAIDEVLAQSGFVDYNLQIQERLDSILKHLEKEFDLVGEDIVTIPCLFIPDAAQEELAVSFFPNLLSALVLGKAFIVPDPHGPLVSGKDLFKKALEEKLEPFSLVVDYLDLGVSHGEMSDGVYRRTSTRRKPHNLDWWLWYM